MICMVSGMHAVCLVWSSVICINHPLYKNFNNSNLCCSPKNFFSQSLCVRRGKKKKILGNFDSRQDNNLHCEIIYFLKNYKKRKKNNLY